MDEESRDLSGPMDPALAGKTILVAVKITYPGSRVTDLLIGDTKVVVSNEKLREAAEKALDQSGTYDLIVNTHVLLGELDED